MMAFSKIWMPPSSWTHMGGSDIHISKGFPLDFLRLPCGFPLGFASISCGFPIDSLCVSLGFRVDFLWIPSGIPIDSLWVGMPNQRIWHAKSMDLAWQIKGSGMPNQGIWHAKSMDLACQIHESGMPNLPSSIPLVDLKCQSHHCCFQSAP